MTNESNKLIYTALGAAAAGAVLAIGVMKFSGDDKDDRPSASQKKYTPLVFMNDVSESGEVNMSHRGSEASLLFPHNHEEKMRRRVATRYSIEEENNTPRDLVTVRVPATSANVGPGCKCFATRCSVLSQRFSEPVSINPLMHLSCIRGMYR